MLFGAKLKHKIFRKTAMIAGNSFIKVSGHNTVERGKIMVEHDLLAANQINAAGDALDGDSDGFCA